MSLLENSLQDILNKSIETKRIFGTVFGIKHQEFKWIGAAGSITVDKPYFIASATKLFTTALILQLHQSKKLNM